MNLANRWRGFCAHIKWACGMLIDPHAATHDYLRQVGTALIRLGVMVPAVDGKPVTSLPQAKAAIDAVEAARKALAEVQAIVAKAKAKEE
jgi:hypothetical protein